MSARPCLPRLLAALAFAALLACRPSPPLPPAPAPGVPAGSDAAARTTAIADAYMSAWFERFPENGTLFGIPSARHDRLTDNGPAAVGRWEKREDDWLAQIREIEPSALAGRPERVTYGCLRHALEASIGMRVCRNHLWSVSQTYNGWPSTLTYLAQIQPVGTPDLRAQALARWGSFPAYLDTEVTNLREGTRLGYTAPRRNVRLVIEQVDGLLKTPPAESPFSDPARRDPDEAFRKSFQALVADRIDPAMRRYRDFLAREYEPLAREAAAVSANRDGPECYRASIRNFTTVDPSPEEIHALGNTRMAAIQGEMATITRQGFGTSDVPALLQRLKTDGRYLFRTRDEIVTYSQAALDRSKRAMSRWFGILPKADVIIQPYPQFREKSAPPGEYKPPADDGSHPGVYLINTYEPDKRSRAGAEAIAFHEVIPGHHLQIAIALERKDAHPVTRYLGSSGFTEGWALYSERLADEMGLYSSDVDRLGLLSSEAFRAARLVVDSGIHALGWSRERAVEYMLAHTAMSPAAVGAEIDRYIAVPGQATSYMIGSLEIRRLRERAEKALGARFDVRRFHDRVLENGRITLPMLQETIESWIAGPAGAADGRARPAVVSRRGGPITSAGRGWTRWRTGRGSSPSTRTAPVDGARIYATGMSNGSMMAYRLAADAADRIAAIAPVAGAMVVETFAPSRAVPVMHVHSVDDPRALYHGGLGPPFPMTNRRVMHPDLEEALARWRTFDGCPETPEVSNRVIDAGEEMWRFFSRHTRTGGPRDPR